MDSTSNKTLIDLNYIGLNLTLCLDKQLSTLSLLNPNLIVIGSEHCSYLKICKTIFVTIFNLKTKQTNTTSIGLDIDCEVKWYCTFFI